MQRKGWMPSEGSRNLASRLHVERGSLRMPSSKRVTCCVCSWKTSPFLDVFIAMLAGWQVGAIIPCVRNEFISWLALKRKGAAIPSHVRGSFAPLADVQSLHLRAPVPCANRIQEHTSIFSARHTCYTAWCTEMATGICYGSMADRAGLWFSLGTS